MTFRLPVRWWWLGRMSRQMFVIGDRFKILFHCFKDLWALWTQIKPKTNFLAKVKGFLNKSLLGTEHVSPGGWTLWSLYEVPICLSYIWLQHFFYLNFELVISHFCPSNFFIPRRWTLKGPPYDVTIWSLSVLYLAVEIIFDFNFALVIVVCWSSEFFTLKDGWMDDGW